MERVMVKEGQYLAVFNSTHRVMKAEKLLKSHKFDILLIPAPRALQTECGLAIRFDENIKSKVMNLLKDNGLAPAFVSQFIKGVYQHIEGLQQ
ncbi:MAG: DUF3343 domain-containing protein [Trichlorobacter sp.]|jgi:hypothetical protein|nr:DUF3343 domain-containing protein [Trichlorobacter sp.]